MRKIKILAWMLILKYKNSLKDAKEKHMNSQIENNM